MVAILALDRLKFIRRSLFAKDNSNPPKRNSSRRKFCVPYYQTSQTVFLVKTHHFREDQEYIYCTYSIYVVYVLSQEFDPLEGPGKGGGGRNYKDIPLLECCLIQEIEGLVWFGLVL